MKNTARCKVSVIIPVYNAEKYLEQMLDSVVKQTLREIEIICVNDGSTDRSSDIIRKFMKKDKRISLFEQENINAGAARNRGLKKARGQFVVFWDADDRFDRRTLELMYRKAVKTGADICVCNVYELMNSGQIYEASYLNADIVQKKDPFSRKDIPEKIFDIASNNPWNKMYIRRFIIR